ncbi:carbonic anhydrase [Natronorubrum sediminis]|uniref:carbonic anhydrase n=1 Tax=Natronorubrum sediminis TaxID=640943 RepID=A0A1H6G542_9EURY|nr:carbonic anhydrase [Natronorubrum sediminis]SEH16995.1 carbonic anhydrase [Natronorubrum sediminis]
MDAEHDVLEELLAGNERHVTGLPEEYFGTVQTGQEPDVVTICCSDSRVPQERMWGTDGPGTVFTPSNIGNQVWDDDAGERIVDGGLLYPIHHTGTDAVAVVGHTGCGAVTAAYNAATGGDLPGPAGVSKWVELLVPVVEEALESGLIDTDADESQIINQLVEYNVEYQTQFLRAADDDVVPADLDIYGFVYDFQGVYGDEHGRAYLVTVNGETDPDVIADDVPDSYDATVRSLLH